VPEWQRWNDYGIGLLLEGDKGSEKGELIQAAEAFGHVERLGRPDGPLNLARVFPQGGTPGRSHGRAPARDALRAAGAAVDPGLAQRVS
jgi:hypothetical protein